MAMDRDSSRWDEPGDAISFWEIERFLLGEMDGSAAEAFRGKLAASAALRAQVERMRNQVPTRTFGELRALKARRERAAAASPAAPGRAAPERRGPAIWWERFRTFPMLRPRPALAFLAAIAATAGLVRFLDPGSPGAGPEGFREKGASRPEFRIRIGDREYAPGEPAQARSGDTLSFLYRSAYPAWVWLGYREDGGEVARFAGADTAGPAWAPATGWTAAPRRILLEGEWHRQDILVLVSPHPVTREKAFTLLAADRLPETDSADGLRRFAFHLVTRSLAP